METSAAHSRAARTTDLRAIVGGFCLKNNCVRNELSARCVVRNEIFLIPLQTRSFLSLKLPRDAPRSTARNESREMQPQNTVSVSAARASAKHQSFVRSR